MLEDFFSIAAITTVVCLVIALPLWGVAVWRRTWTVALWFVAAAVILSVLSGLLAVESESSFAACEASGRSHRGFACANAYFVFAGLWLMALVGYFIAGIVAAIVVEYQGAQTAEIIVVNQTSSVALRAAGNACVRAGFQKISSRRAAIPRPSSQALLARSTPATPP